MSTLREKVARTCRCGAFRVLTATGVRYEENAGAIICHRVEACDAFTRDALCAALAHPPAPSPSPAPEAKGTEFCRCACHRREAWCFDCREFHRPAPPPGDAPEVKDAT